jgi:hypothetical protein
LFEEPLATDEATLPTPHPKLRIAQARPGNRDAIDQMVAWLERDRAAGEGEVRVWLKNWIPEYVPPGGIPGSDAIAAPMVPPTAPSMAPSIAPTIAAAAPASVAPTVSLLARRRR